MRVMIVNERVPAAAGDHVAVGLEGERERDRESTGDRGVDQRIVDPGITGKPEPRLFGGAYLRSSAFLAGAVAESTGNGRRKSRTRLTRN